MKASLEPKEQQIESLKEQLLDLERVFEIESKTISSLQEDEERRKNLLSELTKQVKKEKDRTMKEDKTI